MKKDFNKWNDKKKEIDSKKRNLIFKEGEIWWSYFGINVGEESYGKGDFFRRPVIILKKISENSCIVIPTTTKNKEGERFFKFTTNDLERRAMLYQIKFISANRLYLNESEMNKIDFMNLKNSLTILLGISLWSPSGQNGQDLDHWVSPDMCTCYQICNFCQINEALNEYNNYTINIL